MVESLQMFLFLFKSKYRRKCSWFSPFLCSVLIVLLFCDGVLSKCGDHTCVNGVCKNDMCVCYEGWQGPECQFCGGKVNLTSPAGFITDGPGNYSVSTQCSWLLTPPRLGPTPPPLRVRLESFATECGWDHLYVYDGDSVRAEKLLAVFSGVLENGESSWTRQVIARSGSALLHFFSDDAYAMEGFNVTYAAYSCPSNDHRTNCSSHGECEDGSCRCEPEWTGVACDQPLCPEECNAAYGGGTCTHSGCACSALKRGTACARDAWRAGWASPWDSDTPPVAAHTLLPYGDDLLRVGGETFAFSEFLYRYKSAEKEWEVLPTYDSPAARFAHSAVLYGHELLVYGGVVISDEPERGYKTVEKEWEVLPTYDSPAARFAHSAVLYGHELLVYGGVVISDEPERGYKTVEKEWEVLPTYDSPAARFAHSAVLYGHELLVYGGVVISDEPERGPAARFAHSAVLYGHELLVYGGVVISDEPERGYKTVEKEWEVLPTYDSPAARFAHSAVLYGHELLVYGGVVISDEPERGRERVGSAAYIRQPCGAVRSLGELLVYGGVVISDEPERGCKTVEKEWEVLPTYDSPAARFAHSAVLYGHELLVYGGVVISDEPERGGGLAGLEGRAGEVTNEIWRVRLNSEKPQWHNATPITCSPHRQPPLKHCGGLHVSGHTAVLVYLGITKKPVMLVFFGHSPHYGYLHLVQEYYVDEGVWSVAATRGWAARAGFAHAAAWDPLSRKVYVHGGLVSESEATQAPSASLFEYDPELRLWRPLQSAPTPRYLHSATFITPGVMLVFGGNAHNDSAAALVSNPAASKCYSAGALLYDVRCGVWWAAPQAGGGARAAHAAAPLLVRDRRTVIIHAGFDGRLRSDALIFEAGEGCSRHTSEAACLTAAQHTAVACVWRARDRACLALEEVGWKESFDGTVKACLTEPRFGKDERLCTSAESCAACTAARCAWCGACYPSAMYCVRHTHPMALSIEECGSDSESPREACGRYHSCAACLAHQHHHTHGSEELSQRACFWDYDTIKCKPVNSSEDIRSVAAAGPCSAPCSTFQTCANCTAEECIWCASAGRCVDKNAYGASFPLGGCRAWSTSGGGGCGAARGCGAHVSCAACRAEPACGWCDDGAGGGSGACLPGGATRPHAPRVCAQHRWHFTACPACQCNGHSVCDSAARCMQPCAGRTVGEHCDVCAPGHWGSPLNGGVCQPCECNAQAVACAPDTGRCYCSTKGLAGDRCDKCDNTNHYHADIYNKGACYYDLAVDYQFTFNLSKKEDRHLSAINFRNAPVKPDVDADFSITCSAHARMNLTVRTRSDPAERTLFSDVNCTNFRFKFAKSEHAFGVEDNVTLTTFFVYVYDFRPPLWIQISFSQYPKLNLQQFFITFSSCFLLLLLVAAALWKIKQKYDMYRRRQRLFVEMEQMASRPFSQVCVELEKGGAGAGVPAPVALEPCRGGRAAVLSLLVRLPTGGTGRAPPLGGLAVASALVTLGHHAQHPPMSSAKRPRHH
ncbi:hypothetical protein PYW07_010186 [Mythimna separata]|uniref:CUB domain-containing protein n=1 Tax=Mythimna separata TaxID=271217 RepID=A0AAD7YHM8_MYTSE|nr:hypothetical protein PYW07_010186 [Mythimna separata]